MNSKLLNTLVAIFILVSTCLANNANAALITDNIYLDGNGLKWIYVGEFALGDGDYWDGNDDTTIDDNATPLNGLEAAELLFPGFSKYALSSVNTGIVNYLAWYDAFDTNGSILEYSESHISDIDSDGLFGKVGDVSAYVNNRDRSGRVKNYVFKKAVDIPEPSTLAIFALVLFGLGARRLKSQ
jgi:hypothetical protein